MPPLSFICMACKRELRVVVINCSTLWDIFFHILSLTWWKV